MEHSSKSVSQNETNGLDQRLKVSSDPDKLKDDKAVLNNNEKHVVQENTTTNDINSDSSSEGDAEETARILLENLSIKQNNGAQKRVLSSLDLDGIAKYIQSDKCKNIIIMTGAGLSTAAGIPDFRSPGSGLYDNLEKYDLPHPQCIFDIDFFKHNPEPFFMLAKEMFPGKYKPTLSHYFIRLLYDKGYLLRSYTQNIDGLERVAGIPEDCLVEAHGTFYSAHCIDCHHSHSEDWIHGKIFDEDVSVPRCELCGGIVKPDIVFFGEALPHRYFKLSQQSGTNPPIMIQVFFKVRDEIPRLLLNKEKVYQAKKSYISVGGFDFDSEDKYRDVACLNDCDESSLALAELLGWKSELLKMQADHNSLL